MILSPIDSFCFYVGTPQGFTTALVPCFAVSVPESLTNGQRVSLWCIRCSILFLVVAFGRQLTGRPKTERLNATIWLIGALFAAAHSLGSLATFHHFSQAEAFESTAQQTQDLLGFRFGAGLYVNYVFVVVWLFDALFRMFQRDRYQQLPTWYHYSVEGFLAFIAINGTIVFKSGWLRWTAIACIAVLIGLAWRNHRHATLTSTCIR
jgi:hypothetical protein